MKNEFGLSCFSVYFFVVALAEYSLAAPNLCGGVSWRLKYVGGPYFLMVQSMDVGAQDD